MNLAASAVDNSGPHDRLEEPDRLPADIDDDTLRKYFTLTKADLEQVDLCRGSTNRLGFAIQLCTLRWHGYFPPDTRDIPSSVVEMIGSQLGLLPIAPDNYPLDDEDYRRRMARELNKGKASHDLSRFLCFGKEGVLRGREFGDQCIHLVVYRFSTTPSLPGT